MDEILLKPRPRQVAGQADLFLGEPAPVPAPVSRPDSIGAAGGRAAIATRLESARESVFAAIRTHGPISGAALEQLPELSHLGSSTARKRAGELRDAQRVVSQHRFCSLTRRMVEHFEVKAVTR